MPHEVARKRAEDWIFSCSNKILDGVSISLTVCKQQNLDDAFLSLFRQDEICKLHSWNTSLAEIESFNSPPRPPVEFDSLVGMVGQPL